MAAAFFLNNKVDEVIAKQQRKDLGLCEKCGGLYEGGPGCPVNDCPNRNKAVSK